MSEMRSTITVVMEEHAGTITSPLSHQRRIRDAVHWSASGKDSFSKIALQRKGKSLVISSAKPQRLSKETICTASIS